MSYTKYGLSASTSYYYRVRAKDASSNVGAATAEAIATTAVTDATKPIISSASMNDGPVFTSAAMQIIFSETVDTTSLAASIGLSYASGAPISGTWSQTTFANDTFNFTAPATADLYYLTIDVNDMTGNALTTVQMGLAVYDAAGTPFLYVTTTGSDTTGDGSIATPYLTVQKAITIATGGQAVKVAGGSYTLNSAGQITLTWGAATDNSTLQTAISYEICQSITSSACDSFTPIYATLGGVLSYTKYGLSASTSYYYRVRAKDASSNVGAATAEAIATTAVTDATKPIISSASMNDGPVFTSAAMQIIFSETVDTTSLAASIGLSYASGAPISGTWSQTTFANDTFNFTAPATADLYYLTIDVNDMTGNALTTVQMGLAVYDAAGTPFLYVTTTGSDTTGDGSIATPYLTVQKAITIATAGQAVKVAGGSYTLNSAAGSLNGHSG